MAIHPFLWVHLRANGRARTPFVIAGLFAGAVLAISTVVYYSSNRTDWAAIDSFWAAMLSVGQLAFLLMVAPSSVRRAVLRDFQSGMIESHRLTPLSSNYVMLGYLIGPTIHAILLYTTATVLVAYFGLRLTMTPVTGIKGFPGLGLVTTGWLFGHVCLVILSLLICSVTLLSALATRGKQNVIGLGLVMSFLGGWMMVKLVPGLALITGVMSGSVITGFFRSTTTGGDGWTIIVAAALQLCLALVFLRAAANKLRIPDGALFTLPLATFLLIFTGLVLYAGFTLAPHHDWIFEELGGPERYIIQLFGSTMMFALVSLFLTSAAAVEKFHEDRSLFFGVSVNSAKRTMVMALPFVLAIATIALGIAMSNTQPALQFSNASPRSTLAVAIALFLWYFTDFNLIYTRYSQGRKLLFPLIVLFVVVRGAPVMMGSLSTDLFDTATIDASPSAWKPNWMMGLSGIGTMIMAARDPGFSLWIGLAFQAAIAAVVAGWARNARRRVLEASRRSPADKAAAAITPPVASGA